MLPYGLNESDIHDVLNVFQVTGLDKDGKYFMFVPLFCLFPISNSNQNPRSPCPAQPGDYFTFFAETDLLCALSTCPGNLPLPPSVYIPLTPIGGDLSVYGWGEDSQQRMLDTCRPLGVEVHSIIEEKKEEVLKGWKESEVAIRGGGYGGMHGLKIPIFGE